MHDPLDQTRMALSARWGRPDWGGEDLDSWLGLGISCWFDGHDRVREVSYGIMFATPKGKSLYRYRGQVLGLQIGQPFPGPQTEMPLHRTELQSAIYRQSLDAEQLLEVEVWSTDYSARGERFEAGTIRGIRLIRVQAGPPRLPPPPTEAVLLCVFCCQPLPEGPEQCPACGQEVGQERMEMTPRQFAQAERSHCQRCGQIHLSQALRCPHCRGVIEPL